MHVRTIQTLTALLTCAALLVLCAGPGIAADSVLGAEAAKTIPIADAHFHAMPWMDVQQLPGYMDRQGIRWSGGAAAVGGPARTAEAAAAIGSRYIRATGQSQWISLKQQGGTAALENADTPAFKTRLGLIEAELRDHGARVIGEIHVNTLQSAANPNVLLKIKADAPTLKALLGLAAKYQRPLNVHAQWDPDTAQEIRRLAESNREARLILSHCGVTTSASDIREVFEKHPNIFCDLSFRSPPQIKARIFNRTVFDNNSLRSDWKRLIEDYPDRFVVGIDDQESWPDYETTANNIRYGLLANLSPATAEKVAYRNAIAWFGLEQP